MISTFHLRSMEKRFPKAFLLYMEQGGDNNWNKLCEWIESNGYDSRYYSISLKKIENTL